MDFETTHARLRRSLEHEDGSLDDEATKQLLRERAARFAEAPSESERELAHEVIEVWRAGSRIGLPRARVKEIRVVSLCLLPGTPPTLPGIFHIRGKALCAIDLQPLLGTATPLAHRGRCMIAVLAHPRGDIGLRIDDVVGLRCVYADELDDGDDSAGIEHSDFFTAVTKDLLAIVDVSRMLGHREFTMTSSKADGSTDKWANS